jgi:hypothetical protein
MVHEKVKAAVRRRMARTGESYTTARREVIREFQAASDGDPAGEPERFAISYEDMGPISTWADTRRGGGPAGGRIEVDADELRLRMADFKVDVPRASIRRAARSSYQTRATIGVHAEGGTWLANGSADGLHRRGSSVAAFIHSPARRLAEGMISNGIQGKQGTDAGPDRARPRRGLDMAGHPPAAGRAGPGE